MTSPFFSIITLSKNSQDDIVDTLKSLISQRHNSWESIVQDCVSTDQTLELVSSLKIPSQVVTSNYDSGIYDGLNQALSVSSGEVVGILHCGDIYADEFILQEVEAAFQDPEVDLVYGNVEFFKKGFPNDIVRRWNPGKYKKSKLVYGWMCPHTSTFVRRSIFERYGDYDTDFKVSGDYDFLLRVLSNKDVSVCHLNQVFIKMQLGGLSTSYSFKSGFNIFKEDLRAVKKNNVGGGITVFFKKFRKLLKLK
jgi:glycosyltransferase